MESRGVPGSIPWLTVFQEKNRRRAVHSSGPKRRNRTFNRRGAIPVEVFTWSMRTGTAKGATPMRDRAAVSWSASSRSMGL